MTDLRALHVPGNPLILPNVWDADSARLVEDAGFKAVATGSAAMSATLGYEDQEDTPPAEMFAAIARISRVVNVPVTADVERGYGLKPAELAERLAEAGAAGCNLEDTRDGRLIEIEEQADFLAAVRQAAPGLVINARVDSYVRGLGLEDAISRGRRYRAAGADCVYPFRGTHIAELIEAIDAPINVMFHQGTPSLTELAALGVARISYGSGLHDHVQDLTRRMLASIMRGESPATAR